MGGAFAVGALSVAGVPPAVGFVGKAALFRAVLAGDGPATGALLAALVTVGGALSFVYMFQTYQRAWWRAREATHASGAPVRAVVVVLAAACSRWGCGPSHCCQPATVPRAPSRNRACRRACRDRNRHRVGPARGRLPRRARRARCRRCRHRRRGRRSRADGLPPILAGTRPARAGLPAARVHLPAVPGLLAATVVEVVTGALNVARIVFVPSARARPGIVEMPLPEASAAGLTTLALTLTLSPGSVIVGIDRARGVILVHVIDARDPDVCVPGSPTSTAGGAGRPSSSRMHDALFYVAIAWLGVLAGVTVVLAARARSLLSRVLALDTLSLLLVAALVLVAHARQAAAYLDAALVLALLSFAGTLTAARYYERERRLS